MESLRDRRSRAPEVDPMRTALRRGQRHAHQLERDRGQRRSALAAELARAARVTNDAVGVERHHDVTRPRAALA